MAKSAPPISELCVIGHPSRYGGADTELDHQITCWRRMGISVYVCHTGEITDDLESIGLRERGCIYLPSRDWSAVEGKHCISFCNGDFLANLPEIRRYARTTTFVNCMTWNFDREIEMQEAGLIDFHLYQTEHAFERVSKRLAGAGDYLPLFFSPYFDDREFPFIDDRPQDTFRFGRISRADGDKFNIRQLWIYETMTAPVPKEGMILGWSDQVEAKFGRPPDSYVRTFVPGEISQQEFYRQCEAIIMTCDTFENLPRVGFEAMASGSILVVDNRGGWQALVKDGVTRWLCGDDREFVYKASRCAFERVERDTMRKAARQRLNELAGFEVAAASWEFVFQQWSNL